MSENLKAELFTKVWKEYNAFYSSMCSRSPEMVVNSASEIFCKGQIKDFFLKEDLNFLSDKDCSTLLKTDNILDKVYASTLMTDCYITYDKFCLALNDIVEEVKHDLLPEQVYSVFLDVYGLIHKGGNIGDVKPETLSVVTEKDDWLTHDIEGDKSNLCFISGVIEKDITAKTADEAYSKAMDSANLGDIFNERITGGGVSLNKVNSEVKDSHTKSNEQVDR